MRLPTVVCSTVLVITCRLKELHLSFNEYSTVDITTDVTYPKMLEVHFNGNHVASWAEMKHLGRLFPDLERLIMMDNPLTEFSEGDSNSEFKSLKALCLTRTLISSWTELERLKHFPCLTDVKLLGIPFFQVLHLACEVVYLYSTKYGRLNRNQSSTCGPVATSMKVTVAREQ